MKKKGNKAGADMEAANEIGQVNQSARMTSQLNDSIGLSSEKLRDSLERELTPS